MVTSPSSVGTSTVPPSAAVAKLTGTSQLRCAPSRSKMACSRTCDLDVQIARRAAVASGLAFAAEADAVAGVDARGHFHGQRLACAARAPGPRHVSHGLLDDRAGAPAARAGLLQLEEALRDAHLARAVAGVAGDGRAALGRAAAVAGLALGELRHFDLDGVAEHGLIEIELQLVAQVRAAEHLRAAAAPRRAPKMSPNTSPKMSLNASPGPKPRAAAALAASTPAWPCWS